MGNASGTNESIQLTERRTLSPTTIPSTSSNVPSNSNVVESTRSSSVQPTINSNEMNVKKSIQLEQQQTLLLTKRTSDGFMSTTNPDEQTRRRSSLSTELNTSTRKTSYPINSNSTSTTTNSSKDPSGISNSQMNKSSMTFSSNGTSNEKVVIIDTTAVSLSAIELTSSNVVCVGV